MPSKFAALLIICISVALCTTTLGSPILDDLFHDFIRDSQLAKESPQESTVVKRRIYDNPDGRLKQVSLQSLIGDVEDSLFQTAYSVSSVAHNSDDYKIPEVKPNPNGPSLADRLFNKRHTGMSTGTVSDAETAPASSSSSSDQGKTDQLQAEHIYLQKSQMVPENNGVPAHILIDRVAVHPHQGVLPIIPAFQVLHTKVTTATLKDTSSNAADGSSNDGSEAKISIAQTALHLTNTVELPTTTTTTITTTTTTAKTSQNEQAQHTIAPTTTTAATTTTKTTLSQDLSTETDKAADHTVTEGSVASTTTTETTSTVAATTTAAPSTTTTTTKAPIEQLKEAEEELKEKVAEIEADPVILSARV